MSLTKGKTPTTVESAEEYVQSSSALKRPKPTTGTPKRHAIEREPPIQAPFVTGRRDTSQLRPT